MAIMILNIFPLKSNLFILFA